MRDRLQFRAQLFHFLERLKPSLEFGCYLLPSRFW
jgi:hypothetical protein